MNFLRIFGTRSIKPRKNWPIFSSFNPLPSTPSVYEERKSDCLLYFTYSLSLSKNIEIQRRDICFSSFCISELQVAVPVH